MDEALPMHPASATGPELRARSLALLDFPAVREALAAHARSPMSRERALALVPVHDADAVAELQQETAEAAILLDAASSDLALSRDPRPLLTRAAAQGVLTGDELIAVADGLDLVRRARALGGAGGGRAPLLRRLTRNIADLRALERELRGRLSPSGELRDDASPLLGQLRQESRSAYRAASAGLQALIDADLGAEVLQDRLFTVRGDRLVLPLKAEFRGRIPGIVQGVSDSGATLFVEPLSSVSAGNRWREAAAAEEEEAARVLRRLSAGVARRAREALRALDIAARLDAALAKVRYARSYRGVAVPTGDGALELVDARHPLLGDRAEPVSLALRPPVTALVVTGPNTGGKTVALKTLGLLVLMRQSGLPIPCAPSSRLPIADGVYADIGDEQSIARALSTFSSHISAIAGILAHAGPRSLVLLDELGAATDPEEGAALAKAVVGDLTDRGVRSVVTTHHRALAAFAEEHGRVENASVELDPRTLRPTYRVTMGLPGRSYAMEVAARIGLDARVVEAAHGHLGPERRETESLLAGMQQERRRTRERLDEADAERARAARLSAELERRLEALEVAEAAVVERVRSELLEEAGRVQARLRQAASAAEWQAPRAEPPPRPTIERAAASVEDVRRAVRSRGWGGPAPAGGRRDALRAGETVEVGSLGLTGTVLAAPDAADRVEVLVGSARLRLEASRLRRTGEASEPREGRSSITLVPPGPAAGPGDELDVRGVRVGEALERLDAYVDAAAARGMHRVRIVHGKGTGALRQAVWRHLAGNRAVGGYALAPRERGGDGATEVELV